MNCLQCTSLVSRNASMARNGYSGRKLQADWEFRDMKKERNCASFVRASDEVLQTRAEWAGKTV